MEDGEQRTATSSPAITPSGSHLIDGAATSNGNYNAIIRSQKTSLIRRCFKRKPLEVVQAEEEEGVLERTLGFWDLVALGVGGTIGSGVFVMTGLICHEIAGPAGIISWVVAGCGCLLSGMAFAELSWRVPSAGGAYAYAFVALGELPAAIVGWCMTLEYGISASAVAKSWGEMLNVGLSHATAKEDAPDINIEDPIPGGGGFDMGGVYAALLQGACVLIVVGGLQASTITVNVFCVAKGLLVLFMTSMAFSLYDADNLVPLAPFGAGGVLKGAVAAFFGFLGFDEIVLLAPEAKNPAKHVPRALFTSLIVVTAVCGAASMSLSGALPASEVDADSAFAEAFRDRGMTVAYKITAIGELVTLPLVVLVSFMAQPRLLYAMAKDGLLPHLFAEVTPSGTLLKGSLVSGAACMIIAAVVPFDALDSIISAGVLLAFNFVTSSLLVLRHRACLAKPPSINSSFHVDMAAPPKHSIDETHGKEGITQVFLANLAALASAGVAIRAPYAGSIGCIVLAAVSTGLGGIVLYVLATLQARPVHAEDISGGNFLAPFFPWPQGLALWVNWFLVCQLPFQGILALCAYITFAAAHYTCYGASHSVGNCSGWSLLLSSAASTRTRDDSRCLSLSADTLENALADGGGSTRNPINNCLSPSAGAPLLGEGSEGHALQDHPEGGSGGDATPASPEVTVLPSAQTPSAMPPKLVRRRSTELVL